MSGLPPFHSAHGPPSMAVSLSTRSQPQPDLSFSTEAPLDAAIVAPDAADVLVEAFPEDGLPRDELETEPVLDHGEAPAGEIGDAGQPAGYIVARPGGGLGQSALGRHLPADPLHLASLQRTEGDARDGESVHRAEITMTMRAKGRAEAPAPCRSLRRTCPRVLSVKAITLPLVSRSNATSAPMGSITKISLLNSVASSGAWPVPWTIILGPEV